MSGRYLGLSALLAATLLCCAAASQQQVSPISKASSWPERAARRDRDAGSNSTYVRDRHPHPPHMRHHSHEGPRGHRDDSDDSDGRHGPRGRRSSASSSSSRVSGSGSVVNTSINSSSISSSSSSSSSPISAPISNSNSSRLSSSSSNGSGSNGSSSSSSSNIVRNSSQVLAAAAPAQATAAAPAAAAVQSTVVAAAAAAAAAVPAATATPIPAAAAMARPAAASVAPATAAVRSPPSIASGSPLPALQAADPARQRHKAHAAAVRRVATAALSRSPAYRRRQLDAEAVALFAPETRNGSEASTASVDQLSMPVYGNWCGMGYGAGMPMDHMDACCMSHDNCYDNQSYNRCSCDREILACLHGVLFDEAALVRRGTKAAIQLYFSNTACKCPTGAWTMPVLDSTC